MILPLPPCIAYTCTCTVCGWRVGYSNWVMWLCASGHTLSEAGEEDWEDTPHQIVHCTLCKGRDNDVDVHVHVCLRRLCISFSLCCDALCMYIHMYKCTCTLFVTCNRTKAGTQHKFNIYDCTRASATQAPCIYMHVHVYMYMYAHVQPQKIHHSQAWRLGIQWF